MPQGEGASTSALHASPAAKQAVHAKKQPHAEKKAAAATSVQQLSEEDEFMKPFVDLDN